MNVRDEETVTGCELVEAVREVEDRWPVIHLHRIAEISDGYHFTLVGSTAKEALVAKQFRESRKWETQTYYPVDHPAVLSPDEARLLARGPDDLNAVERQERFKIADRIFTWAEGEGTK